MNMKPYSVPSILYNVIFVRCWLSFESGALYGFLGPVAFVVFVSISICLIPYCDLDLRWIDQALLLFVCIRFKGRLCIPDNYDALKKGEGYPQHCYIRLPVTCDLAMDPDQLNQIKIVIKYNCTKKKKSWISTMEVYRIQNSFILRIDRVFAVLTEVVDYYDVFCKHTLMSHQFRVLVVMQKWFFCFAWIVARLQSKVL